MGDLEVERLSEHHMVLGRAVGVRLTLSIEMCTDLGTSLDKTDASNTQDQLQLQMLIQSI